MDAPVRFAFDPALPVVVAVPTMLAAGKQYVGGDRFDWRSLGLTEQMLHELWRGGAISFVPAEAAAPPSAASASSSSKPSQASKQQRR